MTSAVIHSLRVASALLLLLALASPVAAQEAILTGTVADASGGVLPGVTVTAVHEATGNRFVAVTDDRGVYRVPARRRLPAHRGAAGLYDDFAGRHPAARRTDGHARFSDGGFDDPGNGYGERRGAPAQRRQFEPWWQHQSRTGTGTACPGPQLDGAGDAGARKPHDERFSDNTGAPIAISANSASFSSRSTVSRYLPSAGSAGSRVQPGLDRRVPVHLEQI